MKEKMKRVISLLLLVCCCSMLFAVPAMAESLSDDFSVENANTVKVMVWNNLEDIVLLFEAYEKIKS